MSMAIADKEMRGQVLSRMKRMPVHVVRGRVQKFVGSLVEASGLESEVGHACCILASSGQGIEAEVVGFRSGRTMLLPVGHAQGISPGSIVEPKKEPPCIRVSDALLGRVLDARGEALDGGQLFPEGGFITCPVHRPPPNPLQRDPIDTPMQLGIRAIDACLTMGWGQRMGLFAAAGAGKSTLLGMIAKNSDADVNVVALVGERGREVREFIEQALGRKALQRCVVVVATSDAPPLLRVRAALAATSIAEYFRDRGKRVLLLMDSLTRFMQAQREIGLMLGEPPTTKGYTPSCFSMLSGLIERAGPGCGEGGISAIYTVLVEGDDLHDPVAEAALAILDGHVILDRTLAERGMYPAINVLRSVSRLAHRLMPKEVLDAVRSLRKDLALYERMEDMVHMGAYERGSNPELDRVLEKLPRIREFLCQNMDEACTLAEAYEGVVELMK